MYLFVFHVLQWPIDHFTKFTKYLQNRMISPLEFLWRIINASLEGGERDKNDIAQSHKGVIIHTKFLEVIYGITCLRINTSSRSCARHHQLLK